MMAFIWGLWASARVTVIKWAVITGAVLTFLAAVWLKGYRASQKNFREKQAKARMKQLESKRKINEQVRDLNDKRLDDALGKWIRD